MTTRASLLALAALTAIGLSALAPTDASAWGFHRGGHFHFGRVEFVHHGFYRWGGYRRPYWWAGYRGWRWYHRPYVYAAVGGAVAAPVAAAAQPAQPSCLTKQYLPNGAVAFQDTCTNESAIAPAAGLQPQGPNGPGTP